MLGDFEMDGTPLDAGELQVTHFGVPSQNNPVVARNSAGDFVVVWAEALRDATLDAGIYAQVFYPDGTPRTGEFQVPQLTLDTQSQPDVVIDESGNVLVTWVTVVGTGDDAYDSVRARRFSIDGVPLGDEFEVSTSTDNSLFTPQVGIDAGGNFTIVWEAPAPVSWLVDLMLPVRPSTVANSWSMRLQGKRNSRRST